MQTQKKAIVRKAAEATEDTITMTATALIEGTMTIDKIDVNEIDVAALTARITTLKAAKAEAEAAETAKAAARQASLAGLERALRAGTALSPSDVNKELQAVGVIGPDGQFLGRPSSAKIRTAILRGLGHKTLALTATERRTLAVHEFLVYWQAGTTPMNHKDKPLSERELMSRINGYLADDKHTRELM